MSGFCAPPIKMDGAHVITEEVASRWTPIANVAGADDANARLIAAAPDLLAACEQVIREVECHCRDYPRSPAGSCPACVCRAAVAKAVGP